jgi:hypothetical protein
MKGIKTVSALAGGAVVAAIAALGSPTALAKPQHAALTDRGLGCFVTDAAQNTTFDETCTWHLTVTRDAEGNVEFYSYSDQGHLPPGAALPTVKSQKSYFSQVFFDTELQTFIECSGYELITSKGQYKSNCKTE